MEMITKNKKGENKKVRLLSGSLNFNADLINLIGKISSLTVKFGDGKLDGGFVTSVFQSDDR